MPALWAPRQPAAQWPTQRKGGLVTGPEWSEYAIIQPVILSGRAAQNGVLCKRSVSKCLYIEYKIKCWKIDYTQHVK